MGHTERETQTDDGWREIANGLLNCLCHVCVPLRVCVLSVTTSRV